MISLEHAYRWDDRTAWRVLEGQAFVVALENAQLHKLNPTATRMWELIGEKHTLKDVSAAIAGEFAVDVATAESDVLAFAEELLNNGLIACVDDEKRPNAADTGD
jgi:hypothetical protein